MAKKLYVGNLSFDMLDEDLEQAFAEPSIYILGDIGKTLDCEWMQTIEKHVTKYGPWAKGEDGVYRINVDLFTSF